MPMRATVMVAARPDRADAIASLLRKRALLVFAAYSTQEAIDGLGELVFDALVVERALGGSAELVTLCATPPYNQVRIVEVDEHDAVDRTAFAVMSSL